MTWIPETIGKPQGYVPCNWSEGTDEEIAEALEKHYAGEVNLHDYWSVGDERTIHLNAMDSDGRSQSHYEQNISLVLLNEGGKTLASDGTTECVFIVGLKNCLDEDEHGVSNYTGWDKSTIRTWCNNTFYNAFPSTIKSIFKQHYNYVAGGNNGYNATTYTQTTDYFTLSSVKEITGTISSANANAESNNSLLKYYETSSNRIKYYGYTNNAAEYWTSSKRYYTGSTTRYRTYYCYIFTSGSADYATADAATPMGVAPQGVI